MARRNPRYFVKPYGGVYALVMDLYGEQDIIATGTKAAMERKAKNLNLPRHLRKNPRFTKITASELGREVAADLLRSAGDSAGIEEEAWTGPFSLRSSMVSRAQLRALEDVVRGLGMAPMREGDSIFFAQAARARRPAARGNSTGFVAAKIRAHTNAKRNPLIPTKGPTGARPALPDGDFTFRDVGVMAGFAGGPVDAVMLDGHYVWWDAALDRLNRMGFSLREARDYLASLPNIGTASYSP